MISLTDEAACKVKENLQRRGSGIGIKIGVKTTGCSGLAYTLEYVDQEPKRELCVDHYECNGVSVYIDPKHIPYIDGMTMTWVRKGLNEGFDFINKNERDRCGCGESFRV